MSLTILSEFSLSKHNILCLFSLEREPLLCKRKFSQFVSNHVLCDEDRQVFLAVMYEETNPNEIRKDGARPCLGLYGFMICESLS